MQEKPTSIFIDSKEYSISSLNDDQKVMINHVADIDTKIQGFNFQIQQLQAARGVFFDGLKASLVDVPEVVKADVNDVEDVKLD